MPAQIKQIDVTVDREGFEFNPTSCEPMSHHRLPVRCGRRERPVLGPVHRPTNCATLPFHPTLEASTQGQASKFDGASLTVKVTSHGLGVANIKKVDLQLPVALPSRLSTIQKACVDATFQSTPTPGSACDEGSVIGSATIHTPVFKNPLSGPAYLVSHGGAAFPT